MYFLIDIESVTQTEGEFMSIPLQFPHLVQEKSFFLIWNSKTGLSDLVQLRLHSPADSSVLQRNLQTVGISLRYMEGVALFCGKEGIMYFDIGGKL